MLASRGDSLELAPNAVSLAALAQRAASWHQVTFGWLQASLTNQPNTYVGLICSAPVCAIYRC